VSVVPRPLRCLVLALGLHRAALVLRRVGRELLELLGVGRRLGVAAAAGVTVAVEVVLEQPVYEQIRVAPDRRGEVQVVTRCQAEVADRHRVPHGLRQRAQQQERERLRAGLLVDLIEHGLHAERRRRLVDIDLDRVGLERERRRARGRAPRLPGRRRRTRR
jgi:hypothetical protein